MKSHAQPRLFPGILALIVVSAISASLAAPAAAQDVDFNDGMTHNIDYAITGRIVISNGTTVNLLPGGSIGADTLHSVRVVDTSQFNMTGGTTSGGRIAAEGDSVVTLNGGTIGFHPGSGDSIVTFGNGTIDVFNISALGQAAAVDGTITIYDGSFSGVPDCCGRAASTFGTGTMEIFGGSFDGTVTAQNSSTMIVRGGTFTDTFFTFGDSAVFDVYGGCVSFDGSGVLTGALEDGTPISVNTSGPINLIASPDADFDGVCDDDDECSDSDLSPTIVIGGDDTGVANELFADGCTIGDLIAQLLAADASMDDIVHFLVELKGVGIISGQDMGAILRALNSP